MAKQRKTTKKVAKKVLTLADILPTLQKATAIEEYCDSRYLDTHTIINLPGGEDDDEDDEDGPCLKLFGSERHAETETAVKLDAPITVKDNVITVKDTSDNLIELHLYTQQPLNIKVKK